MNANPTAVDISIAHELQHLRNELAKANKKLARLRPRCPLCGAIGDSKFTQRHKRHCLDYNPHGFL